MADTGGARSLTPSGAKSDKLTGRSLWVMLALMIGIMLSPLNVMFTSIALPTMKNFFSLSVEQASWIAAAYFIPSVALMPLQSQLGSRFGMRKVYGLGLIILSAGAVFAALARSFQWLLVSRVIQGLGWSALYPLALVLINRRFPRGRQGEMMGLWESSVGLTTIVAPLIGGFLVQYLGWRSLYGFMAVFAAVGAVVAWLLIPPSKESIRKPEGDWLSVAGLTLAIMLTLTGISLKAPAILLAAALVWLAWVLVSRRIDQPTIPPGFFRNVKFTAASLAANIRMLAAIAALISLPLFFEEVQGLTPANVGLLMVIYSIFLFAASWPGGRWSDRAGAAAPGIAGYLAMIAGTLLLLGFTSELAIGLVALALAVRGLGAGLSQAPYAKAATESVRPEQTQTAAGLYGTIRYSGLALGTALVGIFLQNRLDYYGALDGGPPAVAAFRELWLVLAGILVVGLAITVIMSRAKPAVLEARVENRGSS